MSDESQEPAKESNEQSPSDCASDSASDSASELAAQDDEMPMPPVDPLAPLSEGASSLTVSKSEESGENAPPPSLGKQMAQLFIIPALICLAAFGVVTLLMNTMSRSDSVESLLNGLSTRTSGGKGLYGIQDPAYKVKCELALHLAYKLDNEIDDPVERAEIGIRLVNILKETHPKENLLQAYLLLAIGKTAPPGGVDEILLRANSDEPILRVMVARSLAAWPENRRDEARAGLVVLLDLLKDSDVLVASEAARVLGVLATPDDVDVIDGLQGVLGQGGAGRDVGWNAAMALARLGEEKGYRIVVNVLLNREKLKELSEAESGPRSDKPMSAQTQSNLMILSIVAFPTEYNKQDNIVWEKIDQIAKEDPDVSVRNAAQRQRMEKRGGQK